MSSIEEPRRTDAIVPGYYKVRLTKGGPWVAAKISYGPPVDPLTGEELDRSWRHRLWIAGQEVPDEGRFEPDPKTGKRRASMQDRLWNVALTGRRIDQPTYQHMLATAEWEVAHRPDLPAAAPRQRVDLGRAKPLF